MKYYQDNKDKIVVAQSWDHMDTLLYVQWNNRQVYYKLYTKLSNSLYSKLFKQINSPVYIVLRRNL